MFKSFWELPIFGRGYRLDAQEPLSKQKGDSCFLESELEFLNNLWGLGTELEQGCCTGPSGYTA
jgi:hypothetical protein